jgi:uncharacterized protein
MGDSGLPQAIEKTLRPERVRVKAIAGRGVSTVTTTLFSPAAPMARSRSCSRAMAFGRVPIHAFECHTSFAETIMVIPKYVLDILVCPVCKTRVELLSDGSGLKCVSCRRVYPVRDDIPVMLPEEAKIAEE